MQEVKVPTENDGSSSQSSLKLTELESIEDVLLQKKKEAEELFVCCGRIPDICGKWKLQRKIKAELNFLMRLNPQSPNLKKNQLRSTNLPHLSAIVECISLFDGVVKLLMPVTYEQQMAPHDSKRVIIDIVADYGRTWVKVVARNPDALLQVSRGAGKFGRKSLIDQVKELIDCTVQNEYMFHPPSVKVCVVGTIDEELLRPLREMQVEVICLGQEKCFSESTETSKDSESTETSKDSESTHQPKDSESTNQHGVSSNSVSEEKHCMSEAPSLHAQKTQNISPVPRASDISSDLPLSAIMSDAILNLDVSCMLAHISDLTNGYCNVELRDTILADQAKREAISPVRLYLDELFTGRKLICCDSAYTRFVAIYTVIGGSREKSRANNFLSRLIIVPDNPSPRSMRLQEIGRINNKSKIIFGTGDTLKAVTVTANAGFIRAAKCQGEKFVAFIHESRALSEMKELIHDDL